jgi:hypothetical protein
MARRLDVVRLQPNWSGDILDLVVDFVTYATSIEGPRPPLWDSVLENNVL